MSPPPPPRLPDLATLTDGQKDELIHALYRTLLALEGTDEGAPPATATPASAPSGDTAALRARIAGSAPSTRAAVPAARRSAGWLRIFEWRAVQLLALLVLLGMLVDAGVGWHQRRLLAAERTAALELRAAAFGGLYVELVRIAAEADGRYRATLAMQTSGPRPLYILMSPVQVFVQSGLAWREVPAARPEGTPRGVVRLEGGADDAVVFDARMEDFAELIPGYMHVRIDSTMLIALDAEPQDLVERANVFYAYLKAPGADDAAIRHRSGFAGDPPLFIPMPPH